MRHLQPKGRNANFRRTMVRGMTLVELMTSLSVITVIILGSFSLLYAGMRTFDKTVTKTVLNSTDAQSVRRVAESIRGAMSLSINGDGTVITYVLPKKSTTNDVLTGEKELSEPLRSDGVTRSYTVNFSAGTLTDNTSGRVILKNISRTDPDVHSSQYGLQYPPFQLTTIGSVHAVSVNLITKEVTRSGTHYVRLKNTAIVRNSQ